MRKSILFIAMISASLTSANAFANDNESKFSVGVSSFATSVDIGGGTDDASGLGITATAVFNELGKGHLGIMANYAAMEHDQLSNLDVNNLDASIIWGSNLTQYGFKFYVGGGFFNEKWSTTGFSETFSGAQITGGVGYNFERFAVDLSVNARNPGAYDFGGMDGEAAATAALSISYRF